jgi:hypothetical protein
VVSFGNLTVFPERIRGKAGIQNPGCTIEKLHCSSVAHSFFTLNARANQLTDAIRNPWNDSIRALQYDICRNLNMVVMWRGIVPMPKGEFRFRFLGYLLWFVGFLPLVLILNRIHLSAEHMIAATLTITPQVWTDTLMAMAFGAYLSILKK